MKQHEAVILAMKQNGGYATFGQLYQSAPKIPGSEWGTKTPFANIRRIVQTHDEIQLTNDPANEYGIAWSPDGLHIVFASDRNGSADLYVMNADGSNVTQLTADSTNESAPAWSPDGKRIAFVSNRGGALAIYVMNADGSDVIQLTNGKSNAYHPSWSPEGDQIAFASDQDGDDDIYLMNADGSNIVQLTGE